MSKDSQGRIWPYAIVIAIILVVIFGAITITIAVKNPVEMSDRDMQNYHHYDANANDIINAKIDFDKKYTISYNHHSFKKEDAVVSYKLVDKNGEQINDANINIIVTRPDNHQSDIAIAKPSKIANGIYTFEVGALPLAGRWDILSEIKVDGEVRYFNLKVDTRNESAFEF